MHGGGGGGTLGGLGMSSMERQNGGSKDLIFLLNYFNF